MSKEARLLLQRWAKRGLIVYLRPYYEGDKLWWVVQVEGGPKIVTEKGPKLSEVVIGMADQVKGRGTGKTKGWLGP